VPESDRRARLRLAAQNGAVRALVNAASPEEGTRELLREVCQNLGWATGAVWMPSGDARVLEARTLWADAGAGVAAFVDTTRATRFPPGTGLPGRVWASGEPAWSVDVTEEPGFTRAEAARAVGLHGAFAVPIPLDGARRGVLEFFSREVLAPDPELLETMSAVGGHLGQFLQRRQAEAALRATEAQFLTFASTVPDATFIIDESSRIVYVNDAVRRIFGYSPSELQGAPLTRLMPERHRRPHMEGLRRFLETGERRVAWEGVAMEGLHRDGTEVPLEITYGTFERDGKRFFTGIARDVTERRRAEEQLRFQARLLDAVGEAVVATDLAGRVLYWNAYAEQLYGWPAAEVLGRNVEEVAPGVLPPESGRERLAGGGRWSGEFTVQDRKGRELPVWITLSPILDGAGRLLGIIGTAIEIQEQKQREEGLRFLGHASRVLASSLDYATTLRSVATLAVPHLGDWCLVHARNPEDGAIAPVARVTPPGATDAVDALESLLTGDDGVANRVLRDDTRLIWPDDGGNTDLPGERLRQAGIHSLLTVPLRARGTALGIITFVSTTASRAYDSLDADIAEELGHRAGLAVDNARLYREAQEGNRAKADFLAVVSHELRTPLNAIAGYADLLAGGIAGPLTELQQRHVERIKVGAGHLAHLIDEVLSYARVETNRERLQLEVTDVAEAAREAAVVLEPDARERGLPLRVDVPEAGPVILTDPGKVRQIVVNLLSNAVKYTEEGEVRIRVRPAGAGVEIQVSDTGIGIEPKAQDRIFEPFWQAEAPNTRSVGGTGLGLSVSRRLAGLLQGSIEVASDVGKGSTFTVCLPDLTGTPHDPREAGPDAAAHDGTDTGPDPRPT
jgi:PAS domain S-box-containing protein